MMSTSVCLSVCLFASISPEPHARSLPYFWHVAYGRVSVLLWQGDEIPREKGNFEVFSSPLTMHVTLSLQITSRSRRSHSVAAGGGEVTGVRIIVLLIRTFHRLNSSCSGTHCLCFYRILCSTAAYIPTHIQNYPIYGRPME